MTFSTIGYYTNSSNSGALAKLESHFGSQLERMSYEQKIVMRAALADYVANKPVWKNECSSITLIDCCIETAGVDWSVWDEDPELVAHIQACSQLDESDIEGLIEALTTQIRGKAYASRIEEWEVVTP